MDSEEKYRGIIGRLRKGEVVEPAEFIDHFTIQDSETKTGPSIGAPFPDFRLPDSQGNLHSLADLLGTRGLLIVFVRSVSWCPYCRNQLAELELSRKDLSSQGVNLVAISPDGPALADKFVQLTKVGYPILSDEGAHFIEQIGILNHNIPSWSTVQNNGRIPFPGQFLLGADGQVIDKHFTEDLRHRASGTLLASRHFGTVDGDGRTVELTTPEARIQIQLSTLRVHTGQDIGIHVMVDLNDGWHMYAAGSEPYTALEISLHDELAATLAIEFPAGRPLRLPFTGETVPVLEGSFRGEGYVRLPWSPIVHRPGFPVELKTELESIQTKPGEHTLAGTVSFQLCSESECRPPATMPFQFDLTIEPDVVSAGPVARTDEG